MRDYSKIYTKFWSEIVNKEMKSLGSDIILMALYIQTNKHANMVGFYHLPIPYICCDTGICEEKIISCLQYLESINFCTYDLKSEFIWVHEMGNEQVENKLDIRDKRVKAVNVLFHSLPKVPFLIDFYHQYKNNFHLTDHFSFETNDEANLKNKIQQNITEVDTIEAPCMVLQSQEQKQEQEQEICISQKPDTQISGIIFSKNKGNSTKTEVSIKESAITVLEFLNQKAERNYRPVDANLKLIKARLSSGVTIAQCRQVIAKKTREWLGNEKMEEYLRPATLFNAIKFEQYLGEIIAKTNVDANDE